MNSLVDILACPMCKLGLDELQARAMEYSIYLMLAMIYSLAGVIGFKIYRMMAREEREMIEKQAVPPAPPAARLSEAPAKKEVEEVSSR
ncbi:MAG: hypothetical protein JO332_08630 [Planctomycetaceae bacterium]|nr:hypothetical protein [Planctomycetaceae bacterium]